MPRLTTAPTEIAGVLVVTRHPLGDSRGFLERVYCAAELPAFPHPPVQINRTLTAAPNTVRGLHLQRPPHAETKLVSCLRGRVFDVAVDLRAGSPTYGRWVGAELSADNHRSLLVPEGCAHGFQTLTADCELLYLHSSAYAPEAEDGVHHASPALGIDWPAPAAVLSDRDAALAPFGPDFAAVEVAP